MSESLPITLSNCRDVDLIADALANDFYDSPVCFFPARLVRAAAKWLATNSALYFFVAESNSQPVGYVFAHTLGPRLWRVFASRHLYLFPHICYTMMRHRLPSFRSHVSSRFAHAMPLAAADRVSELGLPKEDTPFQWSVPDATIGYIEMVYVRSNFRGLGIASSLLHSAVDAMKPDNVLTGEAHIDAGNYASIRAFLGAGWHVVQMSTMDFKASYKVDDDP